jgi:hypothetical protein
MKPKLARSCWFDTMTGKSLRKTGTERERERQGGAAQGSLLLASAQQEVSPSRSISRAPEAHGCTLGKLLLVWCSSHTDLGPREMSLHGHQKCHVPV